MDKKYDILTIGEVNIDLILTGLESMPEWGKEVLVKDVTFTAGGSTVLFALAANKLGLKVNFISKVGEDAFGQFLIEKLKSEGLDTSHILRDRNIKTGLTVALSSEKDRSFVTYLGSISSIKFADINLKYLEQSQHLHLSSYFLQQNLKKDFVKLFQLAKNLGLTTSFDTGYDPDNLWDSDIVEILKLSDIFLPNEIESVNIAAGLSKKDSLKGNLQEVLKELSQFAKIVIIKLGARGAMGKWGEEVIEVEGHKVSVADTTGAGDCFNAGFIYGFLKGWGLEKCLKFANACGALSVTKAGGIEGIANKEQVEEFLESGLPTRKS